MLYEYTAKQRSGPTTTAKIEADSLAMARQTLRRDGWFIVSLQPVEKASSTSVASPAMNHPFQQGRVNKNDLLMMLSQLNIMCRSGVDLAEAIRNVADQVTKPAFRKILQTVHEDISAGISFSESLKRHPTVFDRTLVAGIAAGEQSGTVNQVLRRMTELVRSDIRLRQTVWSMLMYPLVLCGVTIIVLLALVFFVLPQFAKVFSDLGRSAPPLTQAMLDFGQAVNSHRLIVLGLLGSSIVAAIMFRKTQRFRHALDYTTMNAAVLKTATRALLAGRSFRLLGSMLESGVPLVDGIRLCRASISNHLFQKLLDRVERDVLNGEGIGKPLLAATCLPAGAAQMVATAERSGNLGEVLQSVGAYFEEEGERSVRDLVKILEPAVIVVLGVVVAGVVLSVVLPLLDVSTVQS